MCPGIAGLFLHGVAGIGKSVLAAHIADRISSEHPGTNVTTVTGTVTVEQLATILVADSRSLVILDQFEANVTNGTIADRGLAAVLVCLAEVIASRDDQRRHTRVIVTARQPLTLSPHILVRYVGPLTLRSADEFACSLPRLGKLTGAQREYAWRLTAGNPGSLHTLDARLAEARFAKVADSLARAVAAGTGLPGALVFPTAIDPAIAATIASAAESVLGPPPAVTAPAATTATAATAATAPGAAAPRRARRQVLAAVLAAAAIGGALLAVRPLVAGSASVAASHTTTVLTTEAPEAVAGAWLAGNITSGTLIGCDPAMCASLNRRGVAQSDLSPLRPGSDLAADSLIVATPQARTLMGAAIAAAAPELAASFGAGSGQVEVWEVIPGGAAAYRSWRLAADMASRRNGGNLLLGNTNIKASGDTVTMLRSGHVDSRILLALAEIAHSAPLTIASFGAASPGAAPAVPLRSVLIDVANPTAAAAYLKVQDPLMQPLAVRTGHASLWVEFGAPCPLGLFQARS